MFNVIALIATLVPIVFGGYMLFTPMKKLVASVAWMRLPMPEDGSSAYIALRVFWRGSLVVRRIDGLFSSHPPRMKSPNHFPLPTPSAAD